VWAVLALLAAGLLGCDGDPAAPRVTVAEPEPGLVTMHFFDRKITLPRTDASENYQLTTRLWVAQDAPLHNALKITMPWPEKTPRPSGPLLPPRSDGTNKLTVPVRVFWGEGQVVGAGQPVTVFPGQWLPGYRRPRADLYQYESLLLLPSPIPVAGAYRMADGEALLREWTIPLGLEMPAPVELAEPTLVANSQKPIVARWRPVSNAAGYLVFVEADLPDQTGAVARHIVWTSATSAMTLESVYDYAPYLLPGTARQVTVPANIFRGCETIMINVLAVAPTFEDDPAQPTVRIHAASLASHLVVLYQQ
jgi:hypothetical protein